MTEPRKHHILVIGGTGVCGLIFLDAALAEGHTLTLYARNPAKLPVEIVENDSVRVIQGGLSDEGGLKRAAECGADVFVCFAGPTLGRHDGTVSQWACYLKV